jgi:signal transduction histidine kinase
MRQRANDKHLRQLLALQDRERRILACEIHDGFVQDVVAAQIAIDSLLERLLRTDPEAVEQLLRIRAMVRRGIDQARSMVGELRPPLVDELTLANAIQYLVEQEQVHRRLDVRFSHNLGSLLLEPLLQSSIVRIVRESLNNVVRHAQTKDAEVKATLRDGRVRVEIIDRGIGFDLNQVAPGHYGLSGIRERARLFGGKASIRSRPGKGTRVAVEFPVVTER